MARRDDQFPFILTFCRPLGHEGAGRQLFAIVSDGFHECRITVWPLLQFPFTLHLGQLLTIRIVAAVDEQAFERGLAEHVATCYLPVAKVPEVAPRSSPGLWELWLSLEVRLDAARRDELREGEFEARHFERSRELAERRPHAPRICILVQTRHDVASAMSSMIQQNSNTELLNPGGSTASGAAAGAAAGTAMSLSSASTSAAHTPGQAFRDDTTPTSSVTAAGTPPPSVAATRAATPIRASGRPSNSGDGEWRVHYEKERQTVEERRKKYGRHMQAARAAAERRWKMLLRTGALLDSIGRHVCLDGAFCLWRRWMHEEKGRRQFEQLSDDLLRLSEDGTAEILRLEKTWEDVDFALRGHDAGMSQLLERRGITLGVVEVLWGKNTSKLLLSRTLTTWHLQATRQASKGKLIEERDRAGFFEWAATAICVWRLQVGQHHAEKIRQHIQLEDADMPSKIHKACGLRVSEVLEWCYSGQRAESVRRRMLSSYFIDWVSLVHGTGRWRDAFERLSESRLRRRVGTAFVVCCLVAWRGAVRKTEEAMLIERAKSDELLHRRRQQVGRVLEAAWAGSELGFAHVVLVGWHLLAVRGHRQRELEEVFAEHQTTGDQVSAHKERLHSTRAGVEADRVRWAEECDSLSQELSRLGSEVEASESAHASVAEGHEALELQRAEAASHTQTAASSLSGARDEISATSEELQSAREVCEQAEAEASRWEARYEEEATKMQAELARLQGEARKHAETRKRDVKDARRHWQRQLARPEDAARRLAQARDDDRGAWEEKLRKSEAARLRAEAEAQQLRRGAENARFFEECADAEERLRLAEASEAGRAAELQSLREEHTETQQRCEALEHELTFRTRYAKAKRG